MSQGVILYNAHLVKITLCQSNHCKKDSKDILRKATIQAAGTGLAALIVMAMEPLEPVALRTENNFMLIDFLILFMLEKFPKDFLFATSAIIAFA
jgi:hypothetical protein